MATQRGRLTTARALMMAAACVVMVLARWVPTVRAAPYVGDDSGFKRAVASIGVVRGVAVLWASVHLLAPPHICGTVCVPQAYGDFCTRPVHCGALPEPLPLAWMPVAGTMKYHVLMVCAWWRVCGAHASRARADTTPLSPRHLPAC